MAIPSPSASRPLFWSRVLLGIAVLAMVAWFASWFLAPMPSWHREVPFVAIVFAAFASTLKRNARRRHAADQTLQTPADASGWASATPRVILPPAGGQKKTILILDAPGGGVRTEVI